MSAAGDGIRGVETVLDIQSHLLRLPAAQVHMLRCCPGASSEPTMASFLI